MAGIHVKQWTEAGRRVLRLLGTFDAAAASELMERLRCEPERDVVIDVALVRGFDEVGVAALARLVQGDRQHRIALRGLSGHQLRILRYLGAGLCGVGGATAEAES
jgi:anti-anti-sigma regulatory factor